MLAGAEEGGLENHVLSLANYLSRDLRVYLLADEKYRSRLDARVGFYALPMTLGRRHPWLKLRLARQIKLLKPDLVHAHGSKAAALTAAIRPKLACPCIATNHSQKRNATMFECMDGIIGVSQGVLSNIRHHRKEVIYNGKEIYCGKTHVAQDLLLQWRLPAERKLCLAAGRLVEVKGFDTLIRSWQQIDDCLVILGEGPEQAALEKLARDIGVHDRVRLVGYRTDVEALLPAADLVVISSRREGFNYVMAEALMAKVPLVSTRVAGPDEILPAQYLCDVDSPGALAKVIRSALAAPEQLSRIYQPVFERARQEFDVQVMLKKTRAFYAETLA